MRYIKKILNVQKGNVMVFITAVLILSPYLFVFVYNHYYPGTDETYQLQAAYRLAGGYGCTTSPVELVDLPLDLSKRKYINLSNWPPGYSFVIAGLLKTKIPLEVCAKLFKLVCTILGFSLWVSLANKYRLKPIFSLLFMAYLALLFFKYGSSPTDLFLWALMPLYASCLLSEKGGYIRNAFIPGIIAGCMICFKYSAWIVLPLGIIWMLVVHRKNIVNAVVNIATYSVISLIAILSSMMLSLKAPHAITNINLLDISKIVELFHISWIPKTLKSLTITPLRIEDAIWKLSTLLGIANYQWVTYSISVVIAIAVLLILYSAHKKGKIDKRLLRFTLLTLVLQIGFLFFMRVYLEWNISDPLCHWTPLEQARYFFPMLPLMFLCLLVCLSNIEFSGQTNKILETFTCLLLFFVISLSVIYSSRYNGKWYSYYQKRTKLINTVKDNCRNAPVTIIAEKSYFGMFLWEDMFQALRYMDALNLEKTFFSKPTHIFIVKSNVPREHWTNYAVQTSISKDHEFNEKFKYIKARFSFKRILVSNDISLYWKEFHTGRLDDQIEGDKIRELDI